MRSYRGESLRWAFWMQVVALIVLTAVLAYAVVKVAWGWASWVVFGAIVITAIGGIVAINHREYPTKKRSFTRSSDSDW